MRHVWGQFGIVLEFHDVLSQRVVVNWDWLSESSELHLWLLSDSAHVVEHVIEGLSNVLGKAGEYV